MSDWPPRWNKPHFKEPVSSKVQRFIKRTERDGKEQIEKRKVRNRDKFCRFPLCGCGKMKLRTEVSHSTHKGMGGNPAGDRSQAELMVLVCGARHKDNTIAIDRGTLRWRALTARGSNGPIAWDVDIPPYLDLAECLPSTRKSHWFEVARESAPHVWHCFNSEQQRILKQLSEMTL
jgi:hypothetical protein